MLFLVKYYTLFENADKNQLLFVGVRMESVSPVLIWFLLGIAFFVTELILPSFILFFLGIGAWCTASVRAVSEVSLTVQMIIFIVCSLVTVLMLRSWLQSVFLGDSSEESDSVNVDTAPSTGIVIKAIIPPAHGSVKYGGSFWRAEADEHIAEDTVVQILERNDLIIQVRPLKAEKEG
ncbi:MAG: NfeD family protein [Candidatus Electrothrix sp. AR5]|nr:NfeD family protein [Candidatus Electrothrix sp. AR5]